MRIFITGKPGVGKTTLIKKLFEELKDKEVGGFITEEIRKEGRRVGFKMIALDTKEEGLLAYVGKGEPRVGKYRVFVDNIDKIAVNALKRALNKDIILIDEIGAMEFKSKNFKKALDEVLKSNKIIVATLHRNYIDKFKDFGEIIYLTEKNREEVLKNLKKVLL
ncbi:NTPase [Methanocaldococcus sp.]